MYKTQVFEIIVKKFQIYENLLKEIGLLENNSLLEKIVENWNIK